MSQFACVEWDSQELRLLVAEQAKGRIKKLVALAEPLPGTAEDDSGSPQGWAAVLADVVNQHGLQRAGAVVAVRREDVESVRFELPPCDDDQLPNMVAAHLQAELPALGDDAVADFIVESDDPSQPREIQALATARSKVDDIRESIQSAGLVPKCLGLRAAAVESLVKANGTEVSHPTMVICPAGNEAELVMMLPSGGFTWRTIQTDFSRAQEGNVQRLAAEITRTLMLNAADAPSLGDILLLGSRRETEVWQQALAELLPHGVECIDPFVSLPQVDANGLSLTRFSGAFALLQGMLASPGPELNLLEPKRPVASNKKHRPYMLAGVGTALVLLAAAYFAHSDVANLQRQVRNAEKKLARMEKQLAAIEPDAALARRIQTWDTGEIVWLDEMRDLVARFPNADEAVVRSFSGNAELGRGGVIRLSGQVRDPARIVELDQSIRDQYRQMLSRNFHQQEAAGFPWRFESVIATAPRPAESYRDVNPLPDSSAPGRIASNLSDPAER